MTARNWSPVERAEIMRMWMAGQQSTVIAKVFGVTRNSIIGLVHRMNIAGGHKPQPRKFLPRAKPVARKQPSLPATVRAAPARAIRVKPPKPARTKHVGLVDLASDGCRFPVTPHGVRTHLFCNQPQRERSAYCDIHHNLCYGVPASRPFSSAERMAILARYDHGRGAEGLAEAMDRPAGRIHHYAMSVLRLRM